MPTRIPSLLAPMLALWVTHATAASNQLSATGGSLAIDGTCARSVQIEPDPSLSGRIEATATADHVEELAQLATESGRTARLHGPQDECWHPENTDGFRPTLSVALHVPPGMAIAIEEGGGVDYRIGAVGGALTLDISGGVRLRAERVTSLSIELSGGGSVAVGNAAGSVTGDVSGGGDITIDHGALPDLSLEVSGGGGFTLGDGKVAKFNLDMSGGGAVRLGGQVGDATIELSGGGTVQLAQVTGRLTKDVDGSGMVEIGTQPQ